MAVISKLDLDGKNITKYNNATISNINLDGTDYHFAKSSSVENGECVNAVEEPIIDMDIYGNTSQILTDEYQQVEYLESSGAQYIDTGVVPKNNLRANVEFSITEANRVHSILGSRQSQNARFYMIDVSANNKFEYGYLTGLYEFGEVEVNRKYDVDVEFKTGQQAFKVDSEVLYSSTITGEYISSYTLYLFARNQLGTSNTQSKAKIYSCKIYDNENLVRNLIPCFRKADNIAGMYDLVNGIFYTNNGTGEFAVGENTYGINDFQRVEYIESTGEQYINTKIYPSINLTADVVFSTNIIPPSDISDGVFGYRDIPSNSTFGAQIFSNSKIYLDRGSIRGVGRTYAAFEVNKKYRLVSAKTSRAIYNQDGVKLAENLNDITSNIPTSGSIWLFGYNGVTVFRHLTGKIYNFKLIDNDNLVMNLIPCYRKSDNQVGMYDKVNNKFYTNAGTGAFLKGNDVPIQCVGDRTKNLFDKRTITVGKNLNVNTGALYTSTTRSVSNYIEIKANTLYSVNLREGYEPIQNQGSSPYGVFYNSDKSFYPEAPQQRAFDTGYTFTSPINGYVRVNMYIGMEDYLQVEEGKPTKTYEPYGYKIPIQVNLEDKSQSQEFNIYLDEPLRKFDDYVDVLNYKAKKVMRNVSSDNAPLNNPIEEPIDVPTIQTYKGTNIVEVQTEISPSSFSIKYWKQI